MGGTGVVAAFSLASAVIDAAEVAAAWWGLGLGLVGVGDHSGWGWGWGWGWGSGWGSGVGGWG